MKSITIVLTTALLSGFCSGRVLAPLDERQQIPDSKSADFAHQSSMIALQSSINAHQAEVNNGGVKTATVVAPAATVQPAAATTAAQGAAQTTAVSGSTNTGGVVVTSKLTCQGESDKCGSEVRPHPDYSTDACGLPGDANTEFLVSIPQYIYDVGTGSDRYSPHCKKTITLISPLDGKPKIGRVVDFAAGSATKMDISTAFYKEITGFTIQQTGAITAEWWFN